MCIYHVRIILKCWSVSTSVPSHSLTSPFNPQFWNAVIFRFIEESWVNLDLAQEKQLRLLNNGLSEIILREVLRKIESMCRKKKVPSISKKYLEIEQTSQFPFGI